MGAVSVPAPRTGRFSGAQPTRGSAFFPDPEQALLIIDRLRSALLQERIREPAVWSTHCGSGEELHGLAIAAVEELGSVARHVRLVGCDVDEASVVRAESGIYPDELVRGVSQQLVERHFQILGTEQWAALPPTEHPAKFYACSLTEMDEVLAPHSVVVAIHRSPEGEPSSRDLEVILQHLIPGGLLVVDEQAGSTTHPLLEPIGGHIPGAFVRRQTRRPSMPTREQPLRVTCDSSASTLPPSTSSNEVRLLLAEATVLGHHGYVDEAFRLVDEALRRDLNGPMAYLVRAQLNLAAGSVELAIEDLRRLLFLAPTCRLGRYWCAVALRAVHEPERALAQINELERQLANVDASERLEDDTTTVAELRIELAALVEELTTQLIDGGESR